VLDQAAASFTFTGLKQRPVVSVLRGFSAPVNLTIDHSDADLEFLAVHDSDLFNRWQASQAFAMRSLLQIYGALKSGKRSGRGAALARSLKAALDDASLDAAYRAELLRLPSAPDLMREVAVDVDPAIAYRAHRTLARRVATALGPELEKLYRALRPTGPFSPDAKSAGRRALRNTILTLLSARGDPADKKRLVDQFDAATTMTDAAHALGLLAHEKPSLRARPLDQFRDRWQGDDLVIDIWFSAQAQSCRSTALADVKRLLAHPLFKITTPNKVRALINTFASANPVNFHRPDGAGYAFVAEQIVAIDGFNPQVASRLASTFRSWRTLEPVRRAAAQKTLEQLAGTGGLSRDVSEVLSKMTSA
jgi:aminopeptidase N